MNIIDSCTLSFVLLHFLFFKNSDLSLRGRKKPIRSGIWVLTNPIRDKYLIYIE